MALILRESDVQDLIEMDDVIPAVESAMRELGEGEAHNEPRRRAFAPGGLLNVMFASYPGGKCTGLKAYTVSNGRVRFMVVMFGADGALEALIESDFMGAYRTGAATAVMVKARGQLGAAQLESGDLIQAHEAGRFDWSQAVELGAVVAGRWERPDPPGITLFESHGLALWDLAAASVVVAAARKRGGYEEVELFS